MKLKPCPFCDGIILNYIAMGYSVYCESCGATGPPGGAGNKTSSQKKWNVRAGATKRKNPG